jgi:hypothetical protein
VNATFYQSRFVEFMDSIIVTQAPEGKAVNENEAGTNNNSNVI